MTTVLHPPHLGPAQSPYPPPASMAAGPNRAVIAAALVSLVASLGSVTVAGISWATAHSDSTHTATTPAASAPDAGQVAAARTKACRLWSTSANVMDEATNAVAQAPKNWNASETQQALTDEARVIMVESAYLRHHVPAETPSDVRMGIDEYLGASIDMENATAHRKGTARDAAINRANEAESKVTAACR
jgi:hypothetical protein